MSPSTFDAQIQEALALMPETGELDSDAYKALVYTENPDSGKAVLTKILTNKLVSRRLEVKDGVATVYLSRKAG